MLLSDIVRKGHLHVLFISFLICDISFLKKVTIKNERNEYQINERSVDTVETISS